jgi:hypothetical protein
MASQVRLADRTIAQDIELARGLPLDPLSALLRALEYAQSTRRPAWDFALDVEQLRATGLTDCDLRWLACKGFVKHALETSRPPGMQRTFDEEPILRLSECSSFILTQRGMLLTKRLLETIIAPAADLDNQSLPTAPELKACGDRIPSWDRERRELRMGRILVKRFCVPAENHVKVLSAFQEEAWPAHIDDPLPPAAEIDPKRRLHSTIQCLNRNHRAPLLHFHGDGTGCGVRWELLAYPTGAHLGLGWALVEQKRFADAESALREALRLEPANSSACQHLNGVLAGQGKPVEPEPPQKEQDM